MLQFKLCTYRNLPNFHCLNSHRSGLHLAPPVSWYIAATSFIYRRQFQGISPRPASSTVASFKVYRRDQLHLPPPVSRYIAATSFIYRRQFQGISPQPASSSAASFMVYCRDQLHLVPPVSWAASQQLYWLPPPTLLYTYWIDMISVFSNFLLLIY